MIGRALGETAARGQNPCWIRASDVSFRHVENAPRWGPEDAASKLIENGLAMMRPGFAVRQTVPATTIPAAVTRCYREKEWPWLSH